MQKAGHMTMAMATTNHLDFSFLQADLATQSIWDWLTDGVTRWTIHDLWLFPSYPLKSLSTA